MRLPSAPQAGVRPPASGRQVGVRDDRGALGAALPDQAGAVMYVSAGS